MPLSAKIPPTQNFFNHTRTNQSISKKLDLRLILSTIQFLTMPPLSSTTEKIMAIEPDMAAGGGGGGGGPPLRRLDSNGSGSSASSSNNSFVGLASALNTAAHSVKADRRRRSLIVTPSNNELTAILRGDQNRSSIKKKKSRYTPIRRSVSFAGDISVATYQYDNEVASRAPTPSQNETTRIISLPWRIRNGTHDINGRYTGDINDNFQPHGRGTLRYGEGNNNNITGQWKNGELINNKQKSSTTTTYHYHSFQQQRHHSSDGRRRIYRRSNSVPSSLATTHEEDERQHHDDQQHSDPIQSSATTTTGTSLAHFGYNLGDEVKEVYHWATEALQNASSLNALDFAFVLRSNGTWTYSVVAERSYHKDLGLVLRFVLDKKGTTKTLKRKYWEKGVRTVNTSLQVV